MRDGVRTPTIPSHTQSGWYHLHLARNTLRRERSRHQRADWEEKHIRGCVFLAKRSKDPTDPAETVHMHSDSIFAARLCWSVCKCSVFTVAWFSCDVSEAFLNALFTRLHCTSERSYEVLSQHTRLLYICSLRREPTVREAKVRLRLSSNTCLSAVTVSPSGHVQGRYLSPRLRARRPTVSN